MQRVVSKVTRNDGRRIVVAVQSSCVTTVRHHCFPSSLRFITRISCPSTYEPRLEGVCLQTMAEIVGLVASCFTILSLVKKSMTLADNVLEANKILQHIATEVSLTSDVLENLGGTLEQYKKYKFASGSETIKSIEKVAHECSKDLEQIKLTLQKAMNAVSGKSRIRLLRMLQWPSLQKKLERQRSDLEKHKSTLNLALRNLKIQFKYVALFSYGGTLADSPTGSEECVRVWNRSGEN